MCQVREKSQGNPFKNEMQDFMRIAFLVGKRMDMRIKRVPPKKKHEILFYNFPRHVIHDKHNLLRQKMVLDSFHNKFDTIQDNKKLWFWNLQFDLIHSLQPFSLTPTFNLVLSFCNGHSGRQKGQQRHPQLFPSIRIDKVQDFKKIL